MSNQAVAGRQPGPNGSHHQNTTDPLLRNGSFIAPTTNFSAAGTPVKSNGQNRPAAPQATPRSSANGAAAPAPGNAPRPRRKDPAPPEPGSEMASWLPPGWLVEDRVRSSGATAGTVDKYYIEPTSGRRFRSKKDVQYYLETGTVKKRKRGMEASDADLNSSESSINQKNKKPGMNANVSFDYSNVPDEAEWVLTDAKEEIWTSFILGQKVPEHERQAWDAAFTSRTTINSRNQIF